MQNKFPFISGSVIKGQKIARKLGYPTINVNPPSDFLLDFGVYAGFMEYNGKEYPGVINYGFTPCFEVKKPKFEIHIFDFNHDMYGKIVKIVPTHYLRSEIKFKNIDILIQQIKKDCLNSYNYYMNNNFPKASKPDKL